MQNAFDDVKGRVDLVRLITERTGLQAKKTGTSFSLAECPKCQSRSGFKIWPELPGYRCFACDISGDCYNFLTDLCNVPDRMQALRELASDINYDLPETQPQKSDQAREIERIFNAAADFYHEHLLNSEKAIEILASWRKYDLGVIKAAKLGYSGTRSKTRLLAHLRKAKFSEEAIQASGLVKERDEQLQDYFVPNLIIYPHYLHNQCCDFTIKDALKPKKKKDQVIAYRLQKKHVLRDCLFYGQSALMNDEIYLVEGEDDAIQLMRATGQRNVVAITGQPSAQQWKVLERTLPGKRIYLCFDRDEAGEKYSERIFKLIWGSGDIFNLAWPASLNAANDIDEYMRGHIDDLKNGLNLLLGAKTELLRYLINFRIKEYEDIGETLSELETVVERLVSCSSPSRVDIALEEIRRKFKDGAIARILEKRIKEANYSKSRSGASRRYLPFKEDDGIYVREMHNKGDVGLSNFVLRINDIILQDKQIYYRCTLVNDMGEVAEDVIFEAADRANVKKFKLRCAENGAYHFTGNDSDLAGVWQLEESKETRQRTVYVQHYGFVPGEKVWLFDNCAIKSGKIYEADSQGFVRIGNGKLRSNDVLVYSGAVPRLNLTTKFTNEFAQTVCNCFNQVLDADNNGSISTYKGLTFFGFIPATLYSNEIFNKFRFFPFLFSYGPSGTGKTALTSLLLSCFGFDATPESWPSATKDGVHKLLQYLGSMPGYMDEFLNDETFKRLLNTMKNVYNRSGSNKGGIGRRQVQEVNGTLWLSGEDNPGNEALLSRSVIFRFDQINDHKTRSYKWLVQHRNDLSAIARQIILSKTSDSIDAYIKEIQRVAQHIMDTAEKMEIRVALNHAIAAAGLSVLGIPYPDGYLDDVVKHAEKGYAHKLTENPVYQFFTELAHLYAKPQSDMRRFVKYDPTNNTLAISFENAIKLIAKELRQRGEALRIKSGSMKDYLVKDTDGVRQKTERIYMDKNSVLRCVIVELDRLPERFRNLLDFDENQEPTGQ